MERNWSKGQRFLTAFNVCYSHFHSQNDIANLACRKRGDVDAVPLSEIGENEILKSNFHFHPLIVAEPGPNIYKT